MQTDNVDKVDNANSTVNLQDNLIAMCLEMITVTKL